MVLLFAKSKHLTLKPVYVINPKVCLLVGGGLVNKQTIYFGCSDFTRFLML
jgi:hypothetical protein